IFRIYFESLDLGLLDVVVDGACDFLAGMNQNFFGLRIRDVLGDLQTNNVVRHIPENLLSFNGQAIRFVERTNDFFVALQAKRSQEYRGEKFPLAVNTDIKNVFGRFVFELNPRAAVRNDFSQEVALARSGFEKHPGTAM